YESYREHILRVVRRRLHHPLRNRYDSCDFVQSVWMSFFGRGLDKNQFDSPKELVAFLQKMALFKVVEAYRKGTQTARHDCRNERSLQEVHRKESRGRSRPTSPGRRRRPARKQPPRSAGRT